MTGKPDPPAGIWDGVSVAAQSYERELVPAFFESWARELVELAELRPGERVLDLACGTGIVARHAAARLGSSCSITGVDVNPDMLSVARQVSADRGLLIDFQQATALETGLPDAAFDVAFCQQGFQFFSDRARVVRELDRVVAPGGRVAISVWTGPDNPGYAPFDAAFDRHIPHIPEAAAFVRAIFALHDEGALHDLLTSGGFHEVRIERRTGTVRFPSAEAWVRGFLAAAPVPGIATLRSDVFDRIVADANRDLQILAGDGVFTFPLEANVALAYR